MTATRTLLGWSITVALGGFLFGFDTAVISGAERQIQALWQLSDGLHGFAVAIALYGTVLGAMLGGLPSDRLGRKRTLFWVGVFYLVSALGSALAPEIVSFMVFRFLGGIGVGVSSVAAPMYISEIAPAAQRGRLVGLFQFNVVLGILIAYASNVVIAGAGDDAWRWMLGVEAVPALAFVLLVTRVPRSPRWLVVKRGADAEARAVLARIGYDAPTIDRAIADIRASIVTEGGAQAPLFTRRFRFPILLAVLFAFFNQVSGINAIIYYAPRILEMAGLGDRAALLSTAGIGLVNLVFTMLGLTLIDRFGRRTLMGVGSLGLIATLGLVSWAFATGASTWISMLLFVYIAFFAMSQGAVIWVFISEVFPNQVRAGGQALGSFTHWLLAALIANAFPFVANRLGGSTVFALFCGMMVLQLLFVWKVMPETKGLSLETLEARLMGHSPAARPLLGLLLLVGIGIGGAGCAPDLSQNALPTMTATYRESYRPQIHFSPPSAWMNDPNGMVYFDGEYHLFYQYYPDSTVWGPMHWGHATSRDLVRWTHHPVALAPDALGYVFSGSAVVDRHNTTGFGDGTAPPLVAIFTQHDPQGEPEGRVDYQTQGLAYSLDRGRTWTMYDGNPVLPNPGIKDFRDPKVFWHAPSDTWVMALAVADEIQFFASPDLKTWRYLSAFGQDAGAHGGVWECPDLFPLRTPSGQTKWVLLVSINPGAPNGGSGTQYFVGDFDGTTFTSDAPPDTAYWLDEGRDNYAGVTWSDVPEADGRRLFIGWMSNWDYGQQTPTAPWRSAMTLPRTLHLVDTPGGLRVASRPVAELAQLRLSGASPASPAPPFEARLTLDARAATPGFELRNAAGEVYRFTYDRARQRLVSDRTEAGPSAFSDTFARAATMPYTPPSDTLRLHVFVDASSVEVFVDDGRAVMTEQVFPSVPFTELHPTSDADEVTVTPLRSIWMERPAS